MKSDTLVNRVRQILSHLAFHTPLRYQTISYMAHSVSLYSRTMSMDYTKPLVVPAGSDALGQIGESCTYVILSMYYDNMIVGVPSLPAGDLAKINAKCV